MKELLTLLFTFRWKELFFTPTDNGLIKFFRYAFVGGIAFVVDYCGFAVTSLILGDGTFSVVAATTVGFIAGLITNFILSKKFVFTENANVGAAGEFMVYTVIGIGGYIFNILLMLLFVKFMNKYIAKIVVALIVLVYNYLARKIILYSGGDNK